MSPDDKPENWNATLITLSVGVLTSTLVIVAWGIGCLWLSTRTWHWLAIAAVMAACAVALAVCGRRWLTDLFCPLDD